MKKLLLSLTMALAMFAATAQNIVITEKETGNVVENGATYVVFGDGSELWGVPGDELVIEFDILANENMTLHAKKIENNLIEGTSNYICFGQCLAPFVFETDVEVSAAETLLFSAHFMADDYTAILGQEQSLTYEIWNNANPNEKFVINIIFKYSLDNINEETQEEMFGNAYPMPATDMVNFDYNFGANVNSAALVIYNMMGQEMMRNEIVGQSGVLNVNVSDLGDGVYFYSLVINGKTVKSNKLIIK